MWFFIYNLSALKDQKNVHFYLHKNKIETFSLKNLFFQLVIIREYKLQQMLEMTEGLLFLHFYWLFNASNREYREKKWVLTLQ